MKTKLLSAVALSFAVCQAAAVPAIAEEAAVQEPATEFRTVERQAFTTDDLQRYGLSAEDADLAIAYQQDGYELKVLSHEEAEQYTAGITDHEWLLIGILVAVVVIAVSVAD